MHEKFIEQALKQVEKTLINKIDQVDDLRLFVVWSCKTLQNSKCLIGNNLTDDYFEATLNGNDKEFYLDHYTKVSNTHYKLED